MSKEKYGFSKEVEKKLTKKLGVLAPQKKRTSTIFAHVHLQKNIIYLIIKLSRQIML